MVAPIGVALAQSLAGLTSEPALALIMLWESHAFEDDVVEL